MQYYWQEGANKYKPEADWDKERKRYGSYSSTNTAKSRKKRNNDIKVKCELAGISYDGYKYRINKMGMTPEQALSTPATRQWQVSDRQLLKQMKDLHIEGYEIPLDVSFKQLCRMFGKIPATVRRRVKNGQPLADALIKPVRVNDQLIRVNGQACNLTMASEILGIGYRKLRYMLETGKIGVVVWDDNCERLTNGK